MHADDPEPVYIGRLGLTDAAGRRLLIDWRSPAAEPFFGATHADPMGLASRRRYRWTGGRITRLLGRGVRHDGLEGRVALDDQSAFIASLGGNRTARMRDVLATIQADQDAIIRAPSRGALVVDGGPGTGKTVVALHRAAYLLYADPRLGRAHGGVLFVGPHQPYLAYVARRAAGLGEEGVQTCTLRDLVPEGATADAETDAAVARLKAVGRDGRRDRAGRRALRGTAGDRACASRRRGADIALTAEDWAEAFEAPEPGTPHNEARDQVWEALLDDPHRQGRRRRSRAARACSAGRSLQNDELARTFSTGLAAARSGGRGRRPVVGARLPAAVRALARARRGAALQRADPSRVDDADLPLLDAARQRIGDPEASLRRRRREAALAAEREQSGRCDRRPDRRRRLRTDAHVDAARAGCAEQPGRRRRRCPTADPDLLAGPFAHIVVDEAQELTDAEWQMLLRRCPSRSFTIVGDRAQARHGFTESWQERLERVGIDRVDARRR